MGQLQVGPAKLQDGTGLERQKFNLKTETFSPTGVRSQRPIISVMKPP